MKRIGWLLVALVCHLQMMAGDIFVATNGDDRNAGTREHPLATVEQALRQAREWRRLKRPEVKGGIRINLESGTYLLQRPIFIRPEDSGTEESPTVIRGAAVIRGGIRITQWTRGCPLRVPGRIYTALQAFCRLHQDYHRQSLQRIPL